MRIISGEYRGRKLQAVPGENTRPTTDKVKESIFNMIGPYFEGGVCLDLYAGSGALGIEAVSRGMDQAVLVEKHHLAVKTISHNIALTRAEEKFNVQKKTASSALAELKAASNQFSLVFLDPPYAYTELVNDILTLQENDLLEKKALIVCETDRRTDLPGQLGSLYLWKKNQYGATRVWIYIYENGEEDI